jgi:hypothetical protein
MDKINIMMFCHATRNYLLPTYQACPTQHIPDLPFVIIMTTDGVDIFVYMGGEQDVPFDVTHVRIDRSVKIIPARAFFGRRRLVSIKTHDGIEIIETSAFQGCRSLRGIKLPGVREVAHTAFMDCTALSDVEFGDKLETIGRFAFHGTSLRTITMPSVRTIELAAFRDCKQLTDVELPAVERIGECAFCDCPRLQRIAIPSKDSMFHLAAIYRRCTQFNQCKNLTNVDLVGGIHKTISSLSLEGWRDEMNQELGRINQVLPNTPAHEKTDAIQQWIESVINRMEHYKAEHYALLKEDMTQLELALWKAKLNENEDDSMERRAMIATGSARNERRITSGASIVINNVLPFLQLG